MSDERIEINQPFRLIIVCRVDGVIQDLSLTTVQEIEYRSPLGVETKKTATVLNPPGTDGKIYYDVPSNTFNKEATWRVKPHLTFAGGDVIPGDPIYVMVYGKWEKKSSAI